MSAPLEPLPVGVDQQLLSKRFPRLYHMAQLGSWDSIRRHGLLSTSSLLDLFSISGSQRDRIESHHRPESIAISDPRLGTATIRDQKPMDDVGLRRALCGGLRPDEWYRLLNQHVFFWVSTDRLQMLMGARAYREQRHTVLTVRTAPLLNRHAGRVVLSPMNSGATKPFPHPRGRDTFLPIARYPFAEWDRKRHGREPVVELAVVDGVPDIVDFVESVVLRGGGIADEVIWPP